MRQLKVAIIGAGFTGAQHTEAARRIPGVQVVALADSNQALASAACAKMGIPGCYTDYQVMVKEEKPDVVHNCTPNHVHCSINTWLVENGVPVYCEKPLANDSAQSGALCRLAQEKGVLVGVNYNYRQNAMVQEMRARLQQTEPGEEWGRTFLVHGQYLQDWMMYDTDYNWRCIPQIGGPSRTVADIGSHWFDTAQHVLGERIVRVNAQFLKVMEQRKRFEAQGQTFAGQSGKSYTLVDIDTEDAAFITVQFESGILGQLLLSQVTAGAKNDLQLCIDGSHYSMCWRQEEADKLVIGHRERGSILKYASPQTLTGAAKRYASLPAGHAVAWHDALRNGIGGFYAAVRGEGQGGYATVEEADYIVRVVEACIKSSRSGRWEEVEAGIR